MAFTIKAMEAPLRIDEDGAVRIGQTRVLFTLVIDLYKNGVSPETIAVQFPSVALEQVYGAVAYYLQHRAEVDELLEQEEREAESIRRQIEATQRSNPTKAELLARLEAKRRGEGRK